MIVERRDPAPVIPESVFDIREVRRKYATQQAKPAETGSTTEEVRRQIEEFKQLYETPTQ